LAPLKQMRYNVTYRRMQRADTKRRLIRCAAPRDTDPYRRLLMGTEERVAARFNNGKVLKGYVKDFTADSEMVFLDDAASGMNHIIPINDLKALFFIRTFEGDREYRDKKAFGLSPSKGRKVFIKFKDKESLIGFIDGEVPFQKGFTLAKPDGTEDTGFFLAPSDNDSNNIKVFVVGSAIENVTIMVV